MALDTLSGTERPEQKSIHRLIQIGEDELPAHFKNNRVEGGKVVEDTDKGPIEISILALPPEDTQSGLGRFWSRVKAALGSRQPETTELPPTLVEARPKVYSDEYKRGKHVKLMAHMPYVVLEDGTRYGIAVSVPAGLQGQWEDFEAPVNDDGVSSNNKIEIGQKRKGLAVVVRTDDGQPLIRKDLGTTTLQSFQEMLSGRFQPVKLDPSKEQLIIKHKTTVKKGPGLEVGEEQQDQSTQQALLFSTLGANKGVGTVDDKKGRIEIVVYEVVEKQVSEIIDRPLLGLFETRRNLDRFLGNDTLTRRGCDTFRSGFSAGETRFGKETRRRVNVQGVRVERPLAAFQLVLVGEMPEQKMEMVVNE